MFEIPIRRNDIGEELFIMLRLMSYERAVLVAKEARLELFQEFACLTREMKCL